MNRDRLLHPSETYARSAAGVNVATGGDHFLPFKVTAERVVSFPGLTITLIGKGLLDNLHQFGQHAGLLTVSVEKTDELGVQWDPLSMKRIEVAPAEFDLEHKQTHASRLQSGGGSVGSAGHLRPAVHPRISGFDPPALPPDATSVTWLGPRVDLEGAALIAAAWEVEEALGHQLERHDAYRIDLDLDGSNLCLTHWESALAAGAAIPLPRDVPLGGPPQPLGHPIQPVFERGIRRIGVLDNTEEVPIAAQICRPSIIFDPADRTIAQILNRDHLLQRVPAVRRLALYLEFPEPTDSSGRTRLGRFASLRELVEYCGGYHESSRREGFKGMDIVFLSFPLQQSLDGEAGDRVKVRFETGADSGVEVIEVRAQDGAVRFRKHQLEEG